MPNKVLLKKSSVAAKVPLTTDLDYGELALNYTDGRLYYKDGANAIQVIASTASTSGQFTVPSVISVNSSTEALRITQIGSGDALRVEDSANPDATPFVVNAEGRVGIGVNGVSIPGIAGLFITSDDGNRRILHQRMTTDASGPAFIFSKGRGTIAATTAVSSGDILGELQFSGFGDATNRYAAANITAAVDATPGTNDMPGRLVFSTTQDGTTSPTEALRINSSQNVGIGNGVTTTDSAFSVSKPITTGTVAYGIRNFTTVSSNTTGAYLAFSSHAYTAATSFTLGSYVHYEAQQLGFGAGSTVTNQFGFRVQSNLIGATNNYGFFSDIPSGTNRWNFFANGTADNYLGGPLKIGQTYYSNIALGVFWAPAAASVTGIYQDSTINSATTTSYVLNSTFPGTAAASFTLPTLVHYQAGQNTFGAGSTVTNQFGFRVISNLTSATNNYGFYSDIASGTGRWNFFANGTANNYFAGNVGIGTTPTSLLHIQSSSDVALQIRGSAASDQTIQFGRSDVNSTWIVGRDNTDSTFRIQYAASSSVGTLSDSAYFLIDDATGNVGIGTVAPGAKLEVFGTTILGGTTGANRRLSIDTNGIATFRYDDNSLTNAILLDNLASAVTNHGLGVVWRFGTDVSTTAIQSGAIRVAKEQTWTSTASTQDSYMSFATTLDGSLNEKVRITSAGRLGVNNTNPGSLLQVTTAAQGVDGIQVNNGTQNVTMRPNMAVGNNNGIVLAGDTGIIYSASGVGTGSFVIAPWANTTCGLRMNSSGQVAIGLSSPSYTLHVNGSFAATTKSFLITHPTKPNMKLRHGSLEGPEHGVYVRGRLKGKVIELPEYWTKLVDPDSITVQLTAIGKGQKLYVEDVRDNKVYIANDGLFAGDPNCFYLVQAERVDIEKMNVEIEVQ